MTARSNRVHKIGPNQLLWDLGVDKVDSEDEVRRKIVEMEKRFHLVMILEHFEVSISILIEAVKIFPLCFQESLILMKNQLCWSVDDIKNLKLNGRKLGEVKNYGDSMHVVS